MTAAEESGRVITENPYHDRIEGDILLCQSVERVTQKSIEMIFWTVSKCKTNVQAGYDAYLLIPDRLMVGARQNTEGLLPGRISVQSLEAFISQNLEELSHFTRPERTAGFCVLLQTYNTRVDAIETDKSLLIEIPHNLSG